VSYGAIESLRAARPQAKFLELVHRLDRDTSGLLMIAKKRSALVELHRMLREGEVDKRYIALVAGTWPAELTEISEALHKFVTAQGERRVSVSERGVSAMTRVKILKAGEAFSALELQLMTGRTHQIRVHLQHAGHPILGDDKYGDFALNRELAREGVKRLFLHAARLSLRHPLEGERLKLESRLPSDMSAFMKARVA
jgi:23S rRNA pseudouridine955/2504/2580 synthase